MALAKEQELLMNRHNLTLAQARRIDFIAFAYEYIEQNKLTIEVKCYIAPLKWFIKFLKRDRIYCDEINEVLLQKFARFLEIHLEGLTPVTYLNKIKKIIRQAKAEKLLNIDFSQRIKIGQKTKGFKDVLDFSELKLLIQTRCSNNEVKRFLVCHCHRPPILRCQTIALETSY